jgi:NAD(P)-dependent dehydrogenase (short-subunit alcohol dehydrogenase family)
MDIEGSVALVTGANRGIGRAFAEELLHRGAAKVYGAVRDPASITDPRVIPIALDVTDPDRVAAAARTASDVDLVVNNAGLGGLGPVLESTLDDARTRLATNYLGIVSMTQEFAPVLAANGGGAFVNMLSIFSWIAVPSLAIYAASKAAAWSYTNAARVQLAQQGTHVVGVFVQYVDTDLIAGLDLPKVAPRVVAAQALDAAASGAPEAIIDEASRDAKAGLSDDQKLIYPAIREQLAADAGETTTT